MEFKPAPEYVAAVLAINFEDAKKYFTEALLQIHYAHTLMLARQKILAPEEARICLEALDRLDRRQLAQAVYDGRFEDFFFFVEHSLEQLGDPAVIGMIHTARSRNDIDIALYRMRFRQEILQLSVEICALRSALLGLAAANVDTVMPAYTHTQPAQPTTLAHYLLAAVEFLARDTQRMRAAFDVINRSPLGACAITTTGFPIDRDYTAELLGFDGLQRNSYGCIAAVDYLAQSASAVAVCMLSLGRFVQDMLLWCTSEFGFLRVQDGYVQISSIMPQKRNPVSFEHTRILASKAFSQAQAVLTSVHNTPFTDMVDAEDDLQPLLFSMFHDAHRTVSLLAAVMQHTDVDKQTLRSRANRDFLTVTELADTLVRREKISFREAHRLVSEMVKKSGKEDAHEHMIGLLRELAPAVLNRSLQTSEEDLRLALDADHFVAIRSIVGGPAPETVRDEIAAMQQQLTADREWLAEKQSRLDAYPRRLQKLKTEWM
ncbi:MAG: argininosuccinate lyase [Terracidiphilus sp.]